MAPPEQPRQRGLQAVEQDKIARKGFPKIPPRFWLWVLSVLAVWAIIYWKYTQGQLESWRARIMARQRAVAAELGPRFTPLRDLIESWVVEASGAYPGDFVDPEAPKSDFRSRPGVYLRLFIDDARTVDSIRKASIDSLRDGFTSCLTRANNPDPYAGPACRFNHECPTGQHCNEVSHCAIPAQPYNLRVAYRATRVLSEEWVREVREAGNDMRLRLLERDMDVAVHDDIPVAIDLIVRAQYFLLVLDEPAAAGVQVPEAGTQSEALQTVEHPTRVFAYDIKHHKPLLRMRDAVVADIGTPTTDPKTAAAVRRQANNCALALSVRKMLGDEGVQ